MLRRPLSVKWVKDSNAPKSSKDLTEQLVMLSDVSLGNARMKEVRGSFTSHRWSLSSLDSTPMVSISHTGADM